MAIVVVGGGGRGAGKTALVCGVIAALPELKWVAAKVTKHEHGMPQAIYEDNNLGGETDTARYRAAGARQAFLLTSPEDEEAAPLLYELWLERFPGANIIFESNRVLDFVKPDLCLVVAGSAEDKVSFKMAIQNANAIVGGPNSRALLQSHAGETRPVFELENLGRLTPELADWIRGQLSYG